jgi:YD repeat-containing protein
VSTRTYDALDRATNDAIARATGVIGTTQQTFQYDGLGRMTRSTDNGDPADTTQFSTVTDAYDSLSRQLEESQQIGTTGTVRYITGAAWLAEANRTALTYPNGRVVQTTYDALDRLKTLRGIGVRS